MVESSDPSMRTVTVELGDDRTYPVHVGRGAVTRLVGHGRDAVVRASPTDIDLLHAEAAPLVVRDALARVPLPVGPPALIAVGARDPAALPMRQTVSALAFLGRAVSAALSRQ